MAVLAPMPSASVAMAASVKAGVRRRPRMANLKSGMDFYFLLFTFYFLLFSFFDSVPLFRQRLLLDDLAVEEMDRPVGVRGVAGIVRHHADRRARTMQLPQQLHHRFAVFRIEITGGLVCQE